MQESGSRPRRQIPASRNLTCYVQRHLSRRQRQGNGSHCGHRGVVIGVHVEKMVVGLEAGPRAIYSRVRSTARLLTGLAQDDDTPLLVSTPGNVGPATASFLSGYRQPYSVLSVTSDLVPFKLQCSGHQQQGRIRIRTSSRQDDSNLHPSHQRVTTQDAEHGDANSPRNVPKQDHVEAGTCQFAHRHCSNDVQHNQ